MRRHFTRRAAEGPRSTPRTLRRRLLAQALRDEVSGVRHQNVATEPRDQRVFAILTAARTQVAGEPHHSIGPIGVA
jgi:hypothetical protein